MVDETDRDKQKEVDLVERLIGALKQKLEGVTTLQELKDLHEFGFEEVTTEIRHQKLSQPLT